MQKKNQYSPSVVDLGDFEEFKHTCTHWLVEFGMLGAQKTLKSAGH